MGFPRAELLLLLCGMASGYEFFDGSEVFWKENDDIGLPRPLAIGSTAWRDREYTIASLPEHCPRPPGAVKRP
jgi:hypothetical protein